MSFLYYYNGAQKHEGFVGFEKACSRAKTYIILMSLNRVQFYARYCWWRQFLWRSWMRLWKVQKPCINSTWIAWLIHGFLPVKTWLWIACDTAFYAIIMIRVQTQGSCNCWYSKQTAHTYIFVSISKIKCILCNPYIVLLHQSKQILWYSVVWFPAYSQLSPDELLPTRLLLLHHCHQPLQNKWAVTCDFQLCGILTCVDSDEPWQPPFKLRNSKWCSISSLTLIEYSSD